MQISIKTNNNRHYWCAEDGGGAEGVSVHGRPQGLAVANREHVDIWELFTVRFNPDGRVGFRAYNGAWLSAQPDGTLVFNRHRPEDFVPESWEAFRIVPGVEHETYGGVAFITDHGTMVVALNEGGGALLHHQRDTPNVGETFYPSTKLVARPSVPTSGGMDKQQLTAGPGGYGTMVGGQYRLVTSIHDGSDLSQWFYNREECKRRAHISRAANFLKKRTWADVDGPYWEGREDRGHWPDWPGDRDRSLFPDKYGEQAYVDGCVEYLQFHADLGMCIHIARGTGTSTSWDRMAELWREIIRRAGAHCIGVGEGCNEHDAVIPGTPIERVTRYREHAYADVPLRCNSAIGGMDYFAQLVNKERLQAYNPGATIIPFHGYRGAGWQNKLERDWNVKYEWHIKLALDGEGVGVGPYVSGTENMHELNGAFFKLRHALMHACGYIPTLMSGSGVIPDGPRSQEWGTQVGFNEVCAVRDWIPADSGNFIDVYHGGDRWGNKRYFRAINDTRVEHHIEPGTQRGIIIAYGDDAAHIPMHRAFRIDRDEWVEEGHIKGRVIVGQGQ